MVSFQNQTCYLGGREGKGEEEKREREKDRDRDTDREKLARINSVTVYNHVETDVGCCRMAR